MSQHDAFIRQSYALAQQSVDNGNHPFGALLVHQQQVILTAENSVNTDSDVTRHAELNLVSHASQQFSQEILNGSILYTSTEPCLMCCGAIFWSGIRTIVYGTAATSLEAITGGQFEIPSRQLFSQITPQVNVIGPILESEGIILHQTFWK